MKRRAFTVRGGAASGRSRQRGINLIELMIALVLGLLVVGGAISIFVANQTTYATTESLGRIQENTRTAFELMARELREAGSNPCGRNLPTPNNQLPGGNTLWWNTWLQKTPPPPIIVAPAMIVDGLQVYENGAPFVSAPLPPAAGVGSRVAGTDAIEALSASGGAYSFSVAGGGYLLNDTATVFSPGDVVLACDYRDAVLFLAVGVAGTPQFISPAPSAAIFPVGNGAVVARLAASRWYIGDTGRTNAMTGQPLLALFRSTLRQGVVVNEEVAEGVVNMQITHLLRSGVDLNTGYTTGVPAPPENWSNLRALNVTLTLAGRAQGEAVSTSGGGLQRQVNFVVQLRNRTQ